MDTLCPKCANAMIQYERNEVTVDQCTECKGIFLDRGELDRLIAAESAWSQPGQSHDHDDREHGDDRHRGEHGHGGKKRRGRSFLEGLFDS